MLLRRGVSDLSGMILGDCCMDVQIVNIRYYYQSQQMNSNHLANLSSSPTRKGNFKFYSPEKVLVIPRIPSLQKKKFSSPPHQSHLSPSKGPNASYNQPPHRFYGFQSFGTKSCARIDPVSFQLNIINQEDKKSNCSHEKKNVNLKMPNFLLSYSSVNDKKTQKKKTEESFNSNDKKKANKKDKFNGPMMPLERFGKYAIPDIPKIDFSHKTSESSNRHKSPPYALSEVNSSGSNGKSEAKDSQNNQLFVPPQQRHKAHSLQKNQSTKQVKVPAFIRLKHQQLTSQQRNYETKLYGMEKQLNLVNIQSQPELDTNAGGFQFKINIKPAIKKRSFDDFKIIKELGTGSFGKACLAIEKKIGFICVIKIIQKNMVNQYEIKSLMREIKIQSFLDNFHTTALYGFFDDEQKVYLILQLLPTGNLKAMTKNRALPQKSVSNIIFQVLCAIDYMHSNSIIHRDIKPQNIFTFDNYMRLGDFGCAVFCDQLRRSFVGSPCYLSPEQLRNEDYDEKVDVWEIGILTYELLFKVSPFEKDILAIIQGAQSATQLSTLCFPAKYPVTEQAKDFMRKTLRKHPHERISIKQALLHPFVRLQAQELEMLRTCHL